MRGSDPAILEALVADGLLELRGASYRTTRLWQAAMARAAFRLLCSGDDGDDLRVPIAAALVETYGADIPDDRIAAYVEAVLPIEAMELDPRGHVEGHVEGERL